MPLTPPPLDADGVVTPHDHPDIKPDDEVVRRVSAEWTVVDNASGTKRLTSLAFRTSTRGKYPGLSVDLVAFASADGRNPREFVTTPDHVGSIVFRASELRAANFQVGWEPLESNPFHGEVWGAGGKSGERTLRNMATWYVQLPGVSVDG